jgi:hypothetical protein
MDALETTTTPTPVAPAPAPAPIQAPAPASAPMADLSSGSKEGVLDTIKKMNPVEVGFGILGAATLYFAIYYYRYNINAQKAFAREVQNKIDELNIKMADINSVLVQQQQQEQNNPTQSFL